MLYTNFLLLSFDWLVSKRKTKDKQRIDKGTGEVVHGVKMGSEKWVHLDYLDAGANICLTASYQATILGFESKGLSREEAKHLLKRSVVIAYEASEIYADKSSKSSLEFVESGQPSRRPVLIAASIWQLWSFSG
ncbi:unnamed protein product [Linum tenue]|uniref:Hcy-binding domain-containing protein n=1 Tax=Linum tenue TaxID=586396 RepID=A0AAV0RS87_9ROSI|nr:unnamed protein product [Linum tenue]